MVAPLLIMLALGIVQLGLILNRQQGLHAAAREGARSASLPETSIDDINDAVNSALLGVSGSAQVVITVDPNTEFPCAERRGESVAVDVETESHLDIPFLAGRSVDIAGQGVFRCE